MAKQPLWTYHPGNASFYARHSKADFCNALTEVLRTHERIADTEAMRQRIQALVRAGTERYGKQ